MNQPLQARILKLVVFVAVVLVGVKLVQARVVGTAPTLPDAWCTYGVSGRSGGSITGAEVCADAGGNLVPTVTNTQTLGSSSLGWSTIYGATLSGTTVAAGSGGVTNSGPTQLAAQTTAQLALRSDPIGSVFLAAENNQTTGVAVTDRYNVCYATAANVASYLYLIVSTNTAGITPAAAGSACTK